MFFLGKVKLVKMLDIRVFRVYSLPNISAL